MDELPGEELQELEEDDTSDSEVPTYSFSEPEHESRSQSFLRPEVRDAIIKVESNNNPNAVSSAGAMGLMQVMPAMWNSYGGGSDPFNPQSNVQVGTAIYDDEYARFSGNEYLALAAYNAGAPAVIRALNKNGYTLKDAPYVDFSEISADLPEETQQYVPKVISNIRDANNTDQVYEGRQPLEITGTDKILQEEALKVVSSPEFVEASSHDRVAALAQVYNSRKNWTPEAKSLMKDLATDIWDGALPNEALPLADLIGTPPQLRNDVTNPDTELELWKINKLEELQNQGVNPLFLGKQLDDYFDIVNTREKNALKYRQSSDLAKAKGQAVDAAISFTKGGIGTFTSAAAFIPQLLGAEKSAKAIAGIPDLLPDTDPSFGYVVNDEGYVQFDEYGRPLTKFREGISSALGQVGSLIGVGAGIRALGASENVIKGIVGGTNFLGTAQEAYTDAVNNGGTRNQALLASLYSIPSASLDTLGDLAVLGRGKAWISGLKNPWNKARAIASNILEKGAIESTTEAGQQLGQDIGTSTAIQKNIVEGQKILEAGIAGGFAGGFYGGVEGVLEARRPKELPPPGTSSTVPPAPPSTPNEQLALPAPPERLALPAPPETLLIEGPDGSARQLTYNPVAQPDGVISGEHLIHGLNLPDPEEQVRIAHKFEEFQQSPQMEQVFRIKDPKDIDPQLLEHFGLKGVISQDGQRLHVVKETTVIPEELPDLTPEGLDARVEELTTELAQAPRIEDAPYLVEYRKELTQALNEIGDVAKAQAPAVDQLLPKQKELKQLITRLKRDKKGTTNRSLLNARLKDAREELDLINSFLEKNTAGQEAAQLQSELRRVNDALKQLSDPRFPNNQKAKENQLRSLLITKNIAQEETAQSKKEVSDVKAKEAEKQKNIQQGVGIETRHGTRFVLPFEGNWYVLDDQGNTLTKGLPNINQAIDTARSIIRSEQERAFTPSVETLRRGEPIIRPLKFKQRITVPFSIVTPTKFEETRQFQEEQQEQKKVEKKGKPSKKIKVKEEQEGAQVPEAPLKSKLTGSTYSENISKPLRERINYIAAGFGLPETVVGTYQEYLEGKLDSVLSPEQKAFAERAKEKFEASSGVASVEGGKGIILLKSGGESFRDTEIASHEVGHVVFRSIWDNAPEEVRAKVKADFINAAENLNEDDSAEYIAEVLIGPGSKFEGDTRPFSELSEKDQNYLVGKAVGFEEFIANRVKEFVTNPDKAPVSRAEKLYAKIANAFKRIWQNLKNTFAESPTLEQWLNEQFSTERADRFLKSVIEPQPVKPTKEANERSFSYRVRTDAGTTPGVKEKVGVQKYTPISPSDISTEMRAKIKPNDIDANIKEVTDPNSKFSYQDRTVYGIEVMRELERQIREAKAKGESTEALERKEADLAAAHAEEGTKLGQGVQAFALFGNSTFRGWLNRFKQDLAKSFKGKGSPPVLDDATIADLRDIYDKIQKVLDANPNSSTYEKANNVIINTLSQDAVNRVAQLAPTPLVNAISYYWYGNLLSGLSTNTINVMGSGMNLLGQSLGTAITMPNGFSSYMKGLAKGAPKGLEAALGVFRGRQQAKGKIRALNPSGAPTVKFENELMQSLLSKPLNFFNDKLETVFNLLAAQDAFFYNQALEGQSYLAAYRALNEAGESNIPVRIGELLHSSTEEWNKALDLSSKEWEASGKDFNKRDITLRAYEIIEQQRPVDLQKKAQRFGEVTTFNNPPEGTIGAFSKVVNTLIGEIPAMRPLFPFVNVVSNVLSTMLDYSPIGILRAAAGTHLNEKVKELLGRGESATIFNPEERLQRLGVGLASTALASGIYALATAALDDDEPSLAIYSRGPTNKGQAEVLRKQGWSPYSIKIGDTFIKYSETMMAPILAWIGELHDAYRYSPSFNKKNPGEKFTWGLARAAGVVLDMGFLRQISKLMDVVQGDANPNEIIASGIKGFIPFQGLFRDLAKTTDPEILDSKFASTAYLRGLPFISGYYGKPALDAFGEAINIPQVAEGSPPISAFLTPIIGRFTGLKEKDDPLWDYLAANKAYIPKMTTQSTVGVRASKGDLAQTQGRAAKDTLTYEEVYEITKLAGPEIKQGVSDLLASGLEGSKVQERLDDIVKKARARAKVEYFGY